MKTHLDLAREIYRANVIFFSWDELPPDQKAEYIWLAEHTVQQMWEVLGVDNVNIEIIEITSKHLKKGGCCS